MTQKEDILNYFRILKERELIATSYLFIGEDWPLVFELVKLISCKDSSSFCNNCRDCRMITQGTHPDLLIIEPEGFTIKIEAIREGIRFLSLKSFQLRKKILVVKSANALSLEAANAFLKTLEEPPKNSFIGICAAKSEDILPTISSRCRKIFLPALAKPLGPVGAIHELPLLSQVYQFLNAQTVEFKDRPKFAGFLWTLIVFLRENLVFRVGGPSNRLYPDWELETALKSKSIEQISELLKSCLTVYGVHQNINMNLGLQLIKSKL